MSDKHLSTQFDAELAGISNRVLEMGGLVEAQVAQSIYALSHFSGETATQVQQQEERVHEGAGGTREGLEEVGEHRTSFGGGRTGGFSGSRRPGSARRSRAPGCPGTGRRRARGRRA